MKATLEVRDLAAAAEWAAQALMPRPNLPVLAGIRVAAEADGTITMHATDQDIWNHATTSGQVGEPGDVVVPGKVLAYITGRLRSSQKVDITTAGATMTLAYDGGTVTLNTYPAGDYPSLPDMGAEAGTVPAAALARVLAAVLPAVDTGDETPENLRGVRFEIGGGVLTVIATNKYWMPVGRVECQLGEVGQRLVFTVPAKTLLGLTKTTGDREVTILTSPGANENAGVVAFCTPVRIAAIRQIPMPYPPWQHLFNVTPATVAVLDAAALSQGLQLAAALTDNTRCGISMQFRDGEVTVGGGGQTGQVSDTLEGAVTGDSTEVCINPAYLEGAVTGCCTPRVRLAVPEGNNPVVITPEGDGGTPGYQCLVQRIKLPS